MFSNRLTGTVILMAGVLLSIPSTGQPNGPAPAAAGFSIRNARVATKNLEASARFYESAFGLKEVMRIDSPTHFILLSFGGTAEEAKQNTGARIMLQQADTGWAPDEFAYLVLNVPDTYEAVERVKAAGGRVVRDPVATKRPDMTRVVAFVKDPEGNLLELLAEK